MLKRSKGSTVFLCKVKEEHLLIPVEDTFSRQEGYTCKLFDLPN